MADICNLRQLGPTNGIINDLDSKLSEFEHQNQSDSKSDFEIRFWLKATNLLLKMIDFICFWLIFNGFWMFSIKMLIKRSKTLIIMLIKKLKMVKLVKKDCCFWWISRSSIRFQDVFEKYVLFLIIFRTVWLNPESF